MRAWALRACSNGRASRLVLALGGGTVAALATGASASVAFSEGDRPWHSTMTKPVLPALIPGRSNMHVLRRTPYTVCNCPFTSMPNGGAWSSGRENGARQRAARIIKKAYREFFACDF